ncbi:MAG TPA: nucleotidyltransferase domain-containing protein [Elusimicrobiota bacterium]|nr:nucleotidyltransferase domain-containing protein [Elusimicrobiota bacterium]
MVIIFDFGKKMTPEKFSEELHRLWGDDLRSIVLFGSAAAGDFVEKVSDYNLLVVIRQHDPSVLKKAGPLFQLWNKQGNPLPLVFTPQEILKSTDVFPVEFLDIKDHHRTLRGEDPIGSLNIDTRNLRHELEHELKGKWLKLRQSHLVSEEDPEALCELMGKSVSVFSVLLRHTLRLFGEEPPLPKEEAIARLAQKVPFDPQALGDVLSLKSTGKPPRPPAEMWARYMDALKAIIDAVDNL